MHGVSGNGVLQGVLEVRLPHGDLGIRVSHGFLEVRLRVCF